MSHPTFIGRSGVGRASGGATVASRARRSYLMVAALVVGVLELLVASPVASFDPLIATSAGGRASLAIGTVQVTRSQTLAAVSAAFASNSATLAIAGADGARGRYTMSAEVRRLDGCTLVVHQSASLKYDDSAIATFDLDAETTFPLGDIDPASVASVSRPLPRSHAQPAFFAHLATTGDKLSIARQTSRATFNGASRNVPGQDKDEDIGARDSATAERMATALRAAVDECQRSLLPSRGR